MYTKRLTTLLTNLTLCSSLRSLIAVSSIFPGDTFIRTYMKAGEAFFRVVSVDSSAQKACNDRNKVLSFQELLDPKRYELLYRGEVVSGGGSGGLVDSASAPAFDPEVVESGESDRQPETGFEAGGIGRGTKDGRSGATTVYC